MLACMHWCFAIINGRLAEIYFDNIYDGIYGHGFVDDQKFSKSEQKMIDKDIKKCVFTYRNGWYRNKVNGLRHQAIPDPDMEELRNAKEVMKSMTADDKAEYLKKLCA